MATCLVGLRRLGLRRLGLRSSDLRGPSGADRDSVGRDCAGRAAERRCLGAFASVAASGRWPIVVRPPSSATKKTNMNHEKTRLYRTSLQLVGDAARLIHRFPPGLGFLVDHLRRAAASIPLNFAEVRSEALDEGTGALLRNRVLQREGGERHHRRGAPAQGRERRRARSGEEPL